MIVAIDGPAGAGKSTIAQQVAQRLGFQLIDTGAIYRSVGLKALEQGIDLHDGPSVAALAAELKFAFRLNEGENQIICNGDVMGQEIRTPEISYAASIVSAHPQVREALLNIQRELGRSNNCVLEGRDIGTVVFPDAEVKIFLTATDEVRAKRRFLQMKENGDLDANLEEILSEIQARDARDTSRAAAPLKQADDALAIDSSTHDIDDVVTLVINRVAKLNA